MSIAFKTYDFNKSSYLNYKSKLVAEASVDKTAYKNFKENAHKLRTEYHDDIKVAPADHVNTYYANYSPSVFMLSGESYLDFLDANSDTESLQMPQEGVHWSKADRSIPLSEWARANGDLQRVETNRNWSEYTKNDAQTYYDYKHTGPDTSKQLMMEPINILPFIKAFRVQNPTFLAKSADYRVVNAYFIPEFGDRYSSNTEYYTKASSVAKLCRQAATYFDNILDGGVAVLSGVAYENSAAHIEGTKLSVKTTAETTEIGELAMPDTPNGVGVTVKHLYGSYATKVIDVDYEGESPTLEYEGEEGFEAEVLKNVVNDSNYTGFLNSYNTIPETVSALDPTKVRDEFLTLGTPEDDNLRARLLNELDGIIEAEDDPISLEEAVLSVAPILVSWLANGDADIPESSYFVDESDGAGGLFGPPVYITTSQPTFYMSTSTLKWVFAAVKKYFEYLEYLENKSLERIEDYPLGKILNLQGGMEQYLSMDLPSFASIVSFAFKVVNFDDISIYDKGNDPDKASKLAPFRELIRTIGKRRLFKCLRVVVKTDYEREVDENGDYIGNNTYAGAIVASYVLDPVALLQELRPIEAMQVILTFHGYLNIFAKKKRSFFDVLFQIVMIVVITYMTWGAATGYVVAQTLIVIGGVMQVVGVLTGSEKLMTIGSVLQLAGGLMAAGKGSMLKGLTAKVSNVSIIQALQYAIKLASYVQARQYKDKFRKLQSATQNAIDETNEMEELITQMEFDRKVDRFIYGDHIENTYTRLYEYEYKYSYI